jgi:hypothetical protein
MIAGAAEVDITPEPGIDLSGFMARTNPSTSVLDPIFVKAVYAAQLEGEAPAEPSVRDSAERLGGSLALQSRQFLWLHADVLGFDRAFVARFREWASAHLDLQPHEVLLSATHTHSAPTPMILIGCGERDPAWVERLFKAMTTAASEAKRFLRPATLVTATAELNVAIDRRKKPTAHVDPRVAAVGWKDERGQFIAVILNYTMHPVALGSKNRAISSDWCGYAAARASRELSGAPIVLMTNGAAGNINPPWENVEAEQLRSWGEMIPASIDAKLSSARAGDQTLKVVSTISQMPRDVLSVEQIDAVVAQHVNPANIPPAWANRYADAIRTWERNRKAQVARGINDSAKMETMAIRLGDLLFVTAGGEFFSRYADLVRDASGKDVHIIGYANGNFGYVAPSAAYDEGGYEVDSAHFFYDTFRAKRGAFEQLARDAGQLVRQL